MSASTVSLSSLSAGLVLRTQRSCQLALAWLPVEELGFSCLYSKHCLLIPAHMIPFNHSTEPYFYILRIISEVEKKSTHVNMWNHILTGSTQKALLTWSSCRSWMLAVYFDSDHTRKYRLKICETTTVCAGVVQRAPKQTWGQAVSAVTQWVGVMQVQQVDGVGFCKPEQILKGSCRLLRIWAMIKILIKKWWNIIKRARMNLKSLLLNGIWILWGISRKRAGCVSS